MMDHHTIVLHAGKEKPVLQGHPWIFSGAVKTEPKNSSPGDLVDILDSQKQFLARGYYNAASQIRARVLTRDPNEMIDRSFIEQRIVQSVARRKDLLADGKTNAVRLVAHESDRLSGLIVDRYDHWLSFQIVTAGMERWRSEIIEILKEVCKPQGMIERSDEAVREKEGLTQRKEFIFGNTNTAVISILENGMSLNVDIVNGHKTGFYLDQRDSRKIVGEYARGLKVLNCFSYTGGFSVAALKGGAVSVQNVDESLPALEIAKQNIQLNGFVANSEDFVRADVFKYLRELREKEAKFDMVILDPPKFVSSSAQLDKACRGYKDLNILGMQLLNPGGLLVTFSCSGLLSRDLFQKVVFGASVDAGVEIQILKFLSQAEDHPTLLSFPESTYLKGLLLRKI